MKARHPNVDHPPQSQQYQGALSLHPFTLIIQKFFWKLGMPRRFKAISHDSMYGWTYYCPFEHLGYYFGIHRDYQGATYVNLSIAFGYTTLGRSNEVSEKLLMENGCLLGPFRYSFAIPELVCVEFCLHEYWLTAEQLIHRLNQLDNFAIFSRDKFTNLDKGIHCLPEEWFTKQIAS